jgi:hypothetical protein
MIRAVGKVRDSDGERHVLILGLLPGDVYELTAGEMLMVECAEIGLPPMQVQVMAGPSEAAIMDRLPPLVMDGSKNTTQEGDWRG